jgi:uncharacterized protein YkuJ
MPSRTVAAPGLMGVQQPRIRHVPPYTTTSGDEAIALARLAGIELDPWQQMELRDAMGESPDWKCPHCTYRVAEKIACLTHPRARLLHPWSAFEVTDVVPRQNGKSEKLLVRMLAGLFLLEEPLQIYSAHLFDTAMEIFRRLVFVVENCDDLRREVKHRGSKMVGVKYSHGEEGIELRDGRRIRFKARTAGGGRGFSSDTLYLDEAMILPEGFLGPTIPTLSARANPQIWFAGSAPDEDDPAHDGVVLARRRERALTGEDKTLAYFEHSADGEHPDEVDDEVLDDPQQWALANPSLGIRITSQYVGSERAAMGRRQFAVERLGIGAWPRLDDLDPDGISLDSFAATLDEESEAQDPVTFALDVRPNRTAAAIGVAGFREDDFPHIEIVEHRKGTAWVVARLTELCKEHEYTEVIYDKASPAASLAVELEAAGIRLRPVSAQELGQACGRIFDAFAQHAIRHLGTPELDAAIRGAAKRPLGDAWAWSRRLSSVDISPLVAVTLALWGLGDAAPSVYEERGLLVI